MESKSCFGEEAFVGDDEEPRDGGKGGSGGAL